MIDLKDNSTPEKSSSAIRSPELTKHTPMENGDVRLRESVINTTYDALQITSLASEQTANLDDDHGRFLMTLLTEVQNGNRSPEDVRDLLNKDRKIIEAQGKMDRLVEGYDPKAVMDALQQNIDSLKPDETLDAYFLDLTNFKEVNRLITQLGGDRVIKDAGKRLANIFRTIHPDMIVGRLGGDEYIVIRKVKKTDQQREFIDILNEANQRNGLPTTDYPPKLFDVKTREGLIPVYAHSGYVRYDKDVDKPRQVGEAEKKQIYQWDEPSLKDLYYSSISPSQNGEPGVIDPMNEPQTITQAMSVVLRANQKAEDAKTWMKENRPDLASKR